MLTKIGKRIRVGVVFKEEGQKIEPKWFLWRGRRLVVKRITYTWRERIGKELVHRFALTDGRDLYELSYWQERLLWFLEAVETDG